MNDKIKALKKAIDEIESAEIDNWVDGWDAIHQIEKLTHKLRWIVVTKIDVLDELDTVHKHVERARNDF